MKSLSVPLLLLICSLANGEPIIWEHSDGGNGHWYEAVPSTLWWPEAMAAASESQWLGVNGHLATIVSQAEHEWVLDNLGQLSAYWLGGYQDPWDSVQPSTNWHWVTGEQWGFTNWYVGEPNDEGPSGPEFYLNTTTIENTWNDWGAYPACCPIGGYIVEYSIDPVGTIISSFGRIKTLYK